MKSRYHDHDCTQTVIRIRAPEEKWNKMKKIELRTDLLLSETLVSNSIGNLQYDSVYLTGLIAH